MWEAIILPRDFKILTGHAKGVPPQKDSIDPYVAAGVAMGMGLIDDDEDLLDLTFDLEALGAFDSQEDYSDVIVSKSPSKAVRSYIWRSYCEDGSLYGISPEDYESADEYTEALNAAKAKRDGIVPPQKTLRKEDSIEEQPECIDCMLSLAVSKATVKNQKYIWRKYCSDGSAFGIIPEDFETAEEYEEALEKCKQSEKRNDS